MSRDLDDLAPEDRADEIRKAVASAFDARAKDDEAAENVNVMHAYHRGATAMELIDAALEEHEARR